MSQGFKRGRCEGPTIQEVTKSTSPGMITVFHAGTYGRFIEIQSNLRRKKFHVTNQSSFSPFSFKAP